MADNIVYADERDFDPDYRVLIEKFTSRTLLISAMSIFTAGTIVGAFAPNFPVLLTARIIQAAGAGIMLPLMQTVFLTIFPMEKRGRAMGMVGLVISFAPAIGPTLSGWAVEAFSWRSLFYIIFPIAVIDLLLAIILMKNVTTLRETQIDILSVILSTLGFGGLLYGFSSAGSSGWTSAEVLTSLLVGAVALIFFIARQMKLKTDAGIPRVFFRDFQPDHPARNACFRAADRNGNHSPALHAKVRGVSAFDTGLMLLPGAIVMGMMSPFIGRVFDKIGGKGLAMTGFFIILLTSLPFMNLTDSTSLIWIVVVYTARLLGTAMIMMPVTTAGINALPRHLIPHGTAMNNTVRQVGGSIGTALLVSVMSSQAAHANASTPANAALHGMNAAFVVAACIALAGFLLSFILKKNRVSPSSSRPLRGKPKEPDHVCDRVLYSRFRLLLLSPFAPWIPGRLLINTM